MNASVTPLPCENCGRPAGPAYCPHCGQEVEARRGPLGGALRELLSDWMSLDSRLVRSLRTLVRPGRLSELYLSGKRAPFLRPFRLYLIASVVLFSTILTLETPDASEYSIYIGGELVGQKAEGRVTRELSLWEKDTVWGRALVRANTERIDRLRQLPPEEVLERLFAGWSRTLPLTLIVFVPFLALGLKLLYHPIRRATRARAVHTLYFDHLIFALHYQSALFFAMAAVWLVNAVAGLELPRAAIGYVAAFIVMILVYLPLALRYFYRESWLRTALKSFLVLYLYSQLLGLAISLSALSALGNV